MLCLRRLWLLKIVNLRGAILFKELKKHGFNIVFAEDAESGHIQILQMENKPDLIILDLNLPALEGEDLGIMLSGMDE
jgi:DNA-binding response OmpR family regulator